MGWGNGKVVKFKGQSYGKLRRKYMASQELFEDPLFPANDNSLGKGLPRLPGRVEWKRPSELTETPRLFVEKASSKDVTQGKLGNCWLVAACASLTTVKELWKQVVPDYKLQEWDPTRSEQYAGIFHFRFWRCGTWIDVVIDDLLPTIDGQLIFCHSTTANEFWSALLEKAYAKLCGSYSALDGGNLCDALIDFTSGIGEMINLREGYSASEKKEKLRKMLLRRYDEQALMCCAISTNDSSQFEARTKTGLVIGHAYGITSVKEINIGDKGVLSIFKSGEKITLIRLRNPWGAKEWNGAFSDGVTRGASGDGLLHDTITEQASTSYASASYRLPSSAEGIDSEDDDSTEADETESLQTHIKKGLPSSASSQILPPAGASSKSINYKNKPKPNQFAYTQEQLLAMNSRSPEWMKIPKSEKEKLGLVFEDDGEFWIPFQDFAEEFTDLSICQLVNTSFFSLRKTWNEYCFPGQWTRPYRAGGCPNHDTFLRNPQYAFDIPKDATEIMVQIIQTDRRDRRNETNARSDYTSIGFHVMRVEDNREYRMHKLQPKAVTSDYCKMRSMFFQGELDKGRYVLVPTTFEPNIETEFLMRFYCESAIAIKELTHDYPEPHWMCAPFCPTYTCVSVITVEGASDLKSDNTYCIIKVEGEQLRSATIEGTYNPDWTLKGVFFRTDVCKPITVELWENKMLQRDTFLGNAVLTGAADNQLTSIKAPLVGRGSKQSEQHPGELRVKMITYDDLDAA